MSDFLPTCPKCGAAIDIMAGYCEACKADVLTLQVETEKPWDIAHRKCMEASAALSAAAKDMMTSDISDGVKFGQFALRQDNLARQFASLLHDMAL